MPIYGLFVTFAFLSYFICGYLVYIFCVGIWFLIYGFFDFFYFVIWFLIFDLLGF